MHSQPKGYSEVKNGDIIRHGDISLGKIRSVCGQESYGWSAVAPYLIGKQYFESGLDCGLVLVLLRRDVSN
ncbi:MAG: hypothetical protein V4732_11775 [Pseudomonadota bacterium]